jgi:hypothetical protein
MSDGDELCRTEVALFLRRYELFFFNIEPCFLFAKIRALSFFKIQVFFPLESSSELQ